MRDLRTGVTKRVSVNSRGRQSSGTVTEVAVDGLCRRVAFVSDAADLALRRTRNRSWKSAVTRANPPGRRQVYIHLFGGATASTARMKKLTFLASATDRGVPGNGDSHSIAYATNADALTFASDASNLSSRDAQRRHDVYQRTMSRARAARSGAAACSPWRWTRGSSPPAPTAARAPAPRRSRRATSTAASSRSSRPRPTSCRTGGVAQIAKAELSGGGRPRVRLASSTRRRARQRRERRAEPDRRRHVGAVRVRRHRRRVDVRRAARQQRRARRDARHRAVGRPLAARRARRVRADHEPDDEPARQLRRVRARRPRRTCSTWARSSARAPRGVSVAAMRTLALLVVLALALAAAPAEGAASAPRRRG